LFVCLSKTSICEEKVGLDWLKPGPNVVNIYGRKFEAKNMWIKGGGIAELVACSPVVLKVRGLNLSAY
jgi:hypothetical protein